MPDISGKQLGRYVVQNQIGQGGMGTVYAAFDPETSRQVAIKTLPEHAATNPQLVARFERELKTVAKLEHVNILPLFDSGKQDDLLYLVMPYITTGTLHEYLQRRGPLALDDAARLFCQIAGAVHYAHGEGVLHRDIKPKNVLLDTSHNARLTDFGIARILESGSDLTASGSAMGTPHYSAPEQSMGQHVDERSDIYSLGVMLYEMLVGGLPFHATTPLALAMKHATEPPPPPRRQRPELPVNVEAVVLKAMAKQPASRFTSAQAMCDALRRAVANPVYDWQAADTLADAPAPDRPFGIPMPPPRPPGAGGLETTRFDERKSSWRGMIMPVLAVVLIAALVLVLAALGSQLFLPNQPSAPTATPPSMAQALTITAIDAGFTPLAPAATTPPTPTAPPVVITPSPLPALVTPAEPTAIAGLPDSCADVLPARVQVNSWARVRLSADIGLNVRQSPDPLATVSGGLEAGAPFLIRQGPSCAAGYRWYAITGNNVSGWVAEADMSAYFIEPLTTANEYLLFASRRWDTDGDGDIDSDDNSSVYLASLASIRSNRHLDDADALQITDNDHNDIDPALAPDGRRIAFTREDASGEGAVTIIDLGDPAAEPLRFAGGSQPSWSPSGEHLAFVCYRDICASGYNRRGYRNLTNGDTNNVNWQPRWSPDGQTIYYLNRSDTNGDGVMTGCDNARVMRVPAAGGVAEYLTPPDFSVAAFSLTPQGDAAMLQIVTEETPVQDGRYCQWDDSSEFQRLNLTTLSAQVVLPAHRFSRQPVFSPQGNELIYLAATGDISGDNSITAYDSRVITLYDLSTGQQTYVGDNRFRTYDVSWVMLALDPRTSAWAGQALTSSAPPAATTAPAREPVTANTPLGGGSGEIAYFANAAGNWDLMLVDVDGGSPRQLTNTPADEALPVWSPDGRQIAFYSNQDGDGELFVMAVSGGAATQLTTNTTLEYWPAWSPDGGWLAFQSGEMDSGEIYTLNVVSRASRRLTNNSSEDWSPTWSPDGQSIIFASARDGDADLYLMDANGGNVQQLTRNNTTDETPAWSPDGRMVAFVSDADGDAEIYLLDLNTRTTQQLTRNNGGDWFPAWSPDGQYLAFASDRYGSDDLFIMAADGSNARRLTSDPADERSPSWRP